MEHEDLAKGKIPARWRCVLDEYARKLGLEYASRLIETRRVSVALAMYAAHINKTPYCDLRETDLATIIRQVSFSGQEDNDAE